MKKYYYLFISFISIICFAPSKNKKIRTPEAPHKDQHRINIPSKKNILWQKIDEINQLAPNEKEFELKKQLKQYSLEELSKEYIQWCKTLSKTEMIKILYRQDQLYRGFNQEDALRGLDRLKYKRPSAVHDIFMQYQKKFILPEMNTQDRTREDRINQLHAAYEQEHQSDHHRCHRSVHFSISAPNR